MSMVRDPCGAPVTEVTTEHMLGGMVARVKQRIILHTVAGNTNGGVIWFPAYHNGGADGTMTVSSGATALATGGINLVSWENASPSTALTNGGTLATAFGGAANVASTNGRALADPAYLWMAANNVEQVMTLAACMTFKFIGTTSAGCGEVTSFNILPSSGLIPPTTGAFTTLPSTVQLLNFCAKNPVRAVDRLEVRYRPDGDTRPRTYGSGCFLSGTADNVVAAGTDSPLLIVSSGTESGGLQYGGDATALGIIWVGLNSTVTGDIAVEFTKIIQYKLRPVVGLTEILPRSGAAATAVASPLVVTEMLDASEPHWYDKPMEMAADIVANSLSRMALSGLSAAAGSVERRYQKAIMN